MSAAHLALRARMSVLARAAGLLGGLALAGCGSGTPPPARVRLHELPATLHEVARGSPVDVLREEFDALPQGWHVITRTDAILAEPPDALRTTLAQEDGKTFLTLAGRGGLYRLIPVEPDTPYLFRGTLRARAFVPAQRPFFGAQYWLAESAKSGTPAELFAEEKLFDRRQPLPSVEAREGWQDVRVAFRTLPSTHTLILACVLIIDDEVTSGEMDFERCQLQRLDERELWEYRAAEGVADAYRAAGLPAAGDWRARRALAAMLGAEQRPALLGLPGERLEFSLEVPEDDPVFTCGVGPWPAGHAERPGTIEHWLRVDGRELLRLKDPVGPLVQESWREVTVELAPFAGRRVRLELGVDGALPGVFGAPQVVARAAPPPGWNVVFVSIDTLRAERLGAYGGQTGATPQLDALAHRSLLFEDFHANAPYTLPAHATLFSGQFPSVHGVQDRERQLSPRRSPLLAELLAARGWRTQAFTAGGYLTPDFGFAQGFDGFSIADPLRHRGSNNFAELARHYPDQDLSRWTGALIGSTSSPVRRWVEAHAHEPFLLFLHTYEVHDYDPPPGTVDCARTGCRSELSDFRNLLFPRQREPFPGTPEDRAHLVHLYDAALKHVDGQLGELLADLDRLGLRERTLIVVTSDHGEEWFERGRLQHGKTLYDEMLRIPLVLYVPGRAPARLAMPAMQVDVLPTLLGALGLPLDGRMQGVDLLAGTPRARPLWAEVDDNWAAKASLREGSWKLVHGPRDAAVVLRNERDFELYDLEVDPLEAHDLAASEPGRLAELSARLTAFQEHLRALGEALGPAATDTELDEGTQKLLEHLGY